jgi:hypothetical protein
LFLRDFQNTIFGHYRVELLPLVRDIGRQRHNVPVDMGIALMAIQRHQIHPLSWERPLQSLGHVVDHVIDSAEQIAVTGYIDNVCAWRNDRVPKQRGIPAEKRHYVFVCVDSLVRVVGMAIQIGANETWPSSRALYMCGKIELRHDRMRLESVIRR